jgi:excisionase family DNA binding protein
MLPDCHPLPLAPRSADPMMTYQDIAELMAISPRTLQRAVAAGELAVVRIGHRTVRIRREDLNAWITRKYKSTAEIFMRNK